MLTFFQKYKLHIGGVLVLFFILSIFLNFGGFFVPHSPTDTVIAVDGEKIPLHKVLNHYERAMNQVQPGVKLDEAARAQKRDEVIRDLVTAVAYKKQTEKYGIFVPDAQVRNSLAQIPAFQQNGQFSLEAYGRAIGQQLRTTPQEFEKEQRVSIAFFKLRWLIQSVVRVSDEELALAYAIRGAEFAKDHAFTVDEKTKKKTPLTQAQIREAFRARLLEEKTMWVFNQWLSQVGSQLKVETHLDRLQGVLP